jgi:hypothetical protein
LIQNKDIYEVIKYDESAYVIMPTACLQNVVNGGPSILNQFAELRGVADLHGGFYNRKHLRECKTTDRFSEERVCLNWPETLIPPPKQKGGW